MTQGRFHAFDLSLSRARHRGAFTLAALALALAASGCGGGGGKSDGGRLSKSQYEVRIQKDGREVAQAFDALRKPPKSLSQLASEIKRGQEKLREVADDLDGIKPPEEVEADNAALVAGVRKVADLLEPLRKGAEDADVQRVQKAVSDLQQTNALKSAQDAVNDMKKKGYEIGTLGK